jgi:hypothetical protein
MNLYRLFLAFGEGAFGVALVMQVTAKKYDYVGAALTVIAWGLAIIGFIAAALIGSTMAQAGLALALAFSVLVTVAIEMWQ